MHPVIARYAENQHGVFSHAQARSAGLGPDAVTYGLHAGRWQALGRGVYRLCGTPPTWEQRLTALVLAAGPCAAASHRSAAALLGIPGFTRSGPPEVTTPRSRRHRDPSTVVHRWRPFPEHHLTVVEGIVTTRVARTLVDLAGVLHPKRTERAVDSCLGARMLSVASLHATFAELAGRGRKGVAVMRAILAERPDDYVAPESGLEVRFRAILRDAGLPDPVRQLDTGGEDGWVGRADFAYRELSLLMEVDGRAHHSAKLDLDADARRDAALRAAGWRHVERFSSEDVRFRPAEVVACVRRHLVDR